MINILGGSGFIGTRLSTLFERDALDYKIIDKVISGVYPSQTVIADVRSVDSLVSAISENATLINLAAEHRDDVRPVSLYDEVNVQGARNLCKVARLKGVRKIIFTSSVAVYGFAPLGTDETGLINPFNHYGRSKYEAELVFREWHREDPGERLLVIVRPTVVFGEQNRGNIYNLIRQIASGRFLMIGKGENLKSMAYVENVASFLKFATTFQPGVYVYNYIDKPDFSMKKLVSTVNRILGKTEVGDFRLPYAVGLLIGGGFDLLAVLTGKRLAISAIRVKKFCSDSMFNTKISDTEFIAPVPLLEALERTVRHEFVETHGDQHVFYSE